MYQERGRVGQPDVRFEGKPSLVNTGNTPARKVRIRIAADILPNPLPDDFGFSIPDELTGIGEQTVGVRQPYVLSGIVKTFVPDPEVSAIKEGIKKALYVWGVVSYEDIFGNRHKTQFGQMLTWWPNGQVFGYYVPGQNDTD